MLCQKKDGRGQAHPVPRFIHTLFSHRLCSCSLGSLRSPSYTVILMKSTNFMLENSEKWPVSYWNFNWNICPSIKIKWETWGRKNNTGGPPAAGLLICLSRENRLKGWRLGASSSCPQSNKHHLVIILIPAYMCYEMTQFRMGYLKLSLGVKKLVWSWVLQRGVRGSCNQWLDLETSFGVTQLTG